MATVDSSWRRILNLIEDGDPTLFAAIPRPPDPAKVDALERTMGRPLPADLREWWQCCDGVDIAAADLRILIPEHYLPMPTTVRSSTGTSTSRPARRTTHSGFRPACRSR